jgi:fibro-slime domain-containing protein
MTRPSFTLGCALALGLSACSSEDAASGAGGAGGAAHVASSGGAGGLLATGPGGAGHGGGASTTTKPPVGCGATVTGVVRDFHAGGDFQCSNSGYVDGTGKACGPWDPSIVGALGSPIGPKRKPVYKGAPKTPSTTGASSFAAWFEDTPGVNLSAPLDLPMTAGGGGTFSFDTSFFFPIDGKLFAAQPGDPDVGPFKSDDQKVRNFHFSYELHTTFRYDQGNVFTFRGDDDVFVYINDRLAVNLGGIHVPMAAKLDLDKGRVELTVDPQWKDLVNLHLEPDLGFTELVDGGVAGTVDLGIEPGKVYAMDFFFLERNCCASNFRMETNFVFVDCGSGVPS